MATAAERAREREIDRLRRAGLDEDGNPLKDSSPEQEPEDEAPEEQDGYDDTPDATPDETEALRAELDQLRGQLSAMQGRVAPTQQELELQRAEARVLRQKLEQAERDRQDEITRLRQELEERNNPLDISEILTPEETESVDPAMLDIVLKIADKVAQRRAPKIDARAEALKALQERETQRVQEHRERVLLDPARGLHNLDILSRDPKFMDWAQSDDVDLDSTINSLLRARTENDVDRYAKIASRKIAQFHAQSKSQAGSSQSKPSGADPKTRLAAGMRRGSGQRDTEAQRDAKLAEARQLARSSSMADRKRAQAILDSIT